MERLVAGSITFPRFKMDGGMVGGDGLEPPTLSV
jgi:hypothetical protein